MKKPILTTTLIAATMAVSSIAGPPVLATTGEPDELTYWTFAEMLEFSNQVEAEIDELCNGDDPMCADIYFMEREEDAKYNALREFQAHRLMITSVNPSLKTFKVYYNDVDFGAKHWGYGSSSELAFLSVHQYEKTEAGSSDRGEQHLVFSSDVEEGGWLASNTEVELQALELHDEVEFEPELWYYYKAVSTESYGDLVRLGDCLESPNYQAGMECRATYVEYGTIYLPYSAETDEPENDNPSDGDHSSDNPSSDNPSGDNSSDSNPSSNSPSGDDPSGDDPSSGDPSDNNPSDNDPASTDPSDNDPTDNNPTDGDPTDDNPSDSTTGDSATGGSATGAGSTEDSTNISDAGSGASGDGSSSSATTVGAEASTASTPSTTNTVTNTIRETIYRYVATPSATQMAVAGYLATANGSSSDEQAATATDSSDDAKNSDQGDNSTDSPKEQNPTTGNADDGFIAPMGGEGNTPCATEFPWWFIVLILACDAVIMWIFWPKKREN